MIKTVCAICDKDDSKLLYNANLSLKDISQTTFSARRIPDKVHYRIVRCKKCGLVYSNPILELPELEKLYKNSRYTYAEYENDLSVTYQRYLQKFLPSINKNNFLEIGCGNGFFLTRALELGFKKVSGVEPSKETVKRAGNFIKNNIINDIFKINQFKQNSIDIICIFQVLDHIPNPNSFLTECFRILKKDGCILCINHNVGSFWAKFLGAGSPIIDIEHTYLYDKVTLRQIFRKNKFTVVDIFDVANKYPLYYWLRMFPIHRKIKDIITKFMQTLCLENKRIWLSVGNIGIFAQKK